MSSLHRNISLWHGDLTRLQIDAVVNAANPSLLDGGGISRAIHNAAGPELHDECLTLGGCDTGDAKITKGYNLPARHIIHTVGPVGEQPAALSSCYRRALELLLENGLRSICFCCISTGIYGYPNRKAARVALSTVRDWLADKRNEEKIHRIVFCTFLEKDRKIYEALAPEIFSQGGQSPSEEH